MMKLAVVLSVLILAAAPQARAMSCVVSVGEHEHVQQSFSSATHVFSAYVEQIRPGTAFGREMPLAELRVLQVWKGPLQPGQSVQGTAEGSVTFVGDGFVPSEGSGVLVYAIAEQPPFMLHSCSRTARLDTATRDIPLLNKLSGKQEYQLGR